MTSTDARNKQELFGPFSLSTEAWGNQLVSVSLTDAHKSSITIHLNRLDQVAWSKSMATIMGVWRTWTYFEVKLATGKVATEYASAWKICTRVRKGTGHAYRVRSWNSLFVEFSCGSIFHMDNFLGAHAASSLFEWCLLPWGGCVSRPFQDGLGI